MSDKHTRQAPAHHSRRVQPASQGFLLDIVLAMPWIISAGPLLYYDAEFAEGSPEWHFVTVPRCEVR